MANVTATPETRITAADLSASTNCFLFVELTAANTVGVTNTAGEPAYGILEYAKSGSGAPASVWPLSRGGTARVKLGATLAAGVEVCAGADGRAIATSTGYRVAGRLITGGVANDIVEIDIYQGRVV